MLLTTLAPGAALVYWQAPLSTLLCAALVSLLSYICRSRQQHYLAEIQQLQQRIDELSSRHHDEWFLVSPSGDTATRCGSLQQDKVIHQ